MADAEKKVEEGGEEEEKTGGKSKKKIFLLLIILFLVGGGGAGYVFMTGEKDGEVDPGKETADALAQEAEGGGGGHDAPPADSHSAPAVDSHGNVIEDEGSDSDEAEVIELKPIKVNLRGETRDVVWIQFYISPTSKEAKAVLEKAKYPIQDALIMLISAKSWKVLNSEEGMILLKREIIRKIEQIVGPGKVQGIGLVDGPLKIG